MIIVNNLIHSIRLQNPNKIKMICILVSVIGSLAFNPFCIDIEIIIFPIHATPSPHKINKINPTSICRIYLKKAPSKIIF